jgi:hypothetical protein
MAHYEDLRRNFPQLPATPSKELDAYAEALDRRDEMHVKHETVLRKISEETEASVAAIPQDAENRDQKVQAALKIGANLTTLENDAYGRALEAADAEVNELFDRLSAREKAVISAQDVDFGQPADDDVVKRIQQYIAALPDTARELITDMNNQSESTSIDIAVGYIPQSKFLRLPSNLAEKIYALWDTQPNTDNLKNGLSTAELLSVAVVNLPCFKDVPGGEFFALLRAQICALIGAPRNTQKSKVRFHEVLEVDASSDKVSLDKITQWMTNNQPAARNLRYFAINFICLTNHVLLSLRSHWKNDASFNSMWTNGLKGALLDGVLASFPYDRGSLFHDVLHPWGLWVLYQTHRICAERDICDNSMKLRFTGAACGTAAYTGAAALLEQMRATKLFDTFFVARAQEIRVVTAASDDIKFNRDKYNLNHRYYGHLTVTPLPASAVKAIAPVLMAYRDVFLKNTSFKDIRAISKVAENADGVRKVLVEKMKALVKDAATKVDDII